ncbi:MAG: hypothetical protein OZSIB_3940 [Candidatus Ozemobacter sibiricus]|uniref:Methyltransferase domain-containing protein n=1 Tax=Candidatus Ozemobacter sibiricus TaxID=2268124 RepID=A0A367ZP32_9BACT|nr:MAG: hypothetical protein OZSIB_3940 [Candidatus Ozemobacter sibiricus]
MVEQAALWAGSFGDDYLERTRLDWRGRCPFFRHVLSRTQGIASIGELGAGAGYNLEALHALNPAFRLTGVEINARACAEMAKRSFIQVVQAPLQVFSPPAPFDLVMTCGVLIHLPPSDLPLIYQRLYDLTNRYILLNEYFSPQPVAMPYRGLEGHLYKRDFGGELWDCHGDRLRLVDYGFLWKRVEQVWDDTTWWLFEKAGQP